MEILSSIIARLSSYNILNYFIPGSAMYILLKFIVGVEWFCGMQWYELILVMYFLGMICNRVSSLIVEKYARKWKFVKFAPYKDFVIAESRNKKIEILSETNNMYRAFIAVMLIAIVCLGIEDVVKGSIVCDEMWKWVVLTVLLLIFLFSYKKQTEYVKGRVEAIMSQEATTQEFDQTVTLKKEDCGKITITIK